MAESLQWSTINDFTPGIASVVSANHPPGTAAPGTVGCIAKRGVNSLIPLPAIVEEVAMGPYLSVLNRTPGQLANTDGFRIAGMYARGPVFATPDQDPSGTRSEVFVALEYWQSAPGDGDRRYFQIIRYRLNTTTRDWRADVWSANYVDTVDWQGRVPANAIFTEVRSNHDDPLDAGPAVIAWCIGPYLRFWPDDANPNSTTSIPMPGDDVVGGEPTILAHQGRIVILPTYTSASGAGSLWGTNENIYWTAVNDIRTLDPLINQFFNQLPSLDNPSGFGAVASLTADELLLIKNSGGALVLRGDLNDWTAINYPYVRSTGDTLVRGVASTVGFVYPVSGGGVYVWTGGQVSEPIADQLDPWFWQTSNPGVTGAVYSQWDTWGDWVLTGNNWLLDAPAGSWWQIDDPDEYPITRWSNTWDGRMMLASPANFHTSSDPVLWRYDLNTPRSEFTWVSQPLNETLDREVELEEVIVVASSPGDVTVTVTTAEDTDGVTVTFPIDGTAAAPQFIRQRVPIAGTQLTFRLHSKASDLSGPAPTVHEIRYGAKPGNRIVNQ